MLYIHAIKYFSILGFLGFLLACSSRSEPRPMSADEFENKLGIKPCPASDISLKKSSGRNGMYEMGLEIEMSGSEACISDFIKSLPIKHKNCENRLNSCYLKNSKAEIYFYKISNEKISFSVTI